MLSRFTTIITVLLISCIVVNAQSSSIKAKVFNGFGYATHIGTTPVYKWEVWESINSFNTGTGENYYGNATYGSFFGCYYQLRLNMLELSDEASLSIEVIPSIDVAYDLWGYGGLYGVNLRTPILLSYNINAGATKSSWATSGVAFSVGANIINTDKLPNSRPTPLPNYSYTRLNETVPLWILPTFKFTGRRKYGPKLLWEYGFQFSIGDVQIVPRSVSLVTSVRPYEMQFHAGFSF